MFKVEMRTQVKDSITGFKGTITARCEYITGCRQYLVTAKGKSDKLGESQWFDEARILTGPKRPRTGNGNKGGPQQYAPAIR